MIKSMTGYGRGICTNDTKKVTVELKSVNHRYLDLGLKLPRKCNPFEADIRSHLKSRIARGKTDVYVTLEESADADCRVVYNPSLAAMYLENLNRMAEEFGLEQDVTVSSLSRYPDILSVEEIEEDAEELQEMVMRALDEALEQFVAHRTAEGERLKKDLLEKMDEMAGYVEILKERSPEIIGEYRARLTEKVRDLLEDHSVDEGRIATEVTIYADKVCIDEEIVRLASHVEATREALTSGGEVGRKLDFIAQEMNREANTILSKSTDVTIANMGIALKTLIEKVREQIQNIE